jgi:hypothetical protein
MGEIVDFPNSLIDDHGFIETLARYAEGSLTERQVWPPQHWTGAGRDGTGAQYHSEIRRWPPSNS